MHESSKQEIVVPQNYYCSITDQIMFDPVFTCEGYTYEREEIEKWLIQNNTDPIKHTQLANKVLMPNWNLKSEIVTFLQNHSTLFDNNEVYLSKNLLKKMLSVIKNNDWQEMKALAQRDPRLLIKPIENDYTAYHSVCQHSSPEMFDQLIRLIERRHELIAQLPKPNGWIPTHLNKKLLEAAGIGDNQAINSFLKLGADILITFPELPEQPYDAENKYGQTFSPLHLATYNGHEETVALLIDKGVNPNLLNSRKSTSLTIAVLKGDVNMVRLLLEKGADPMINDGGMIPLYHSQSILITDLLLKKGGDTHAKDRGLNLCFNLAAWHNNFLMMNFLLKKGADINAPDERSYGGKNTPLHSASGAGREEAVKFLIEEGAQLESQGRWGTPLHAAAREGHQITAKLLLDAGANLESRANAYEDTPLHCAVQFSGRKYLVSMLLDRGADIAAKNHLNDTPLHIAAQSGDEAVVKLLLKKGASINGINSSGRTPAQVALAFNHQSIADLINAWSQKIYERNNQLESLLKIIQRQTDLVEYIKKEQQAISNLLSQINLPSFNATTPLSNSQASFTQTFGTFAHSSRQAPSQQNVPQQHREENEEKPDSVDYDKLMGHK